MASAGEVKPASLIPPKVIFKPPPAAGPGVDGAGLAGVALIWAPLLSCLLRLLVVVVGRTT